MNRPTKVQTFVNDLIDRIAAEVAIAMRAAAVKKKRRGPSQMKGKHFSTAKMRCRFPGCKQRSRGPRYHYLCEKHQGRDAAKRVSRRLKAVA